MMTSGRSYIAFILVILLGLLCANACSEEEPEMTRNTQILADSIVRVETRTIVSEIDSLCDLAYKSNFDKAVDSISKVRLDEIEKYIPSK